MSRILGLDLGTNSIGWAIIDNESKKIIGTGVRVFPEGVENLGEGDREQSKNASRRDARQRRRQYFRLKLRRKKLLKILIEKNMCPLNLQDVEHWYRHGVFPNEKHISTWFKLNPYQLRAKAVSEKISLVEFGRALYNISLHRGFLSNSRNANKKDDGTIQNGKPGEGKAGINETKAQLTDRTLGQYLASILPEENATYKAGLPRVRNRYTEREMYVNEFEKMWIEQSKHHQILDEELKKILGGRKSNGDENDGIIFFQRPLRSQKYLIGSCTFEKNKPRCPISAIPVELFRIYQYVNTIECDGKKLDSDDRESAIQVLKAKEKPKFIEIRKKLNKTDDGYRFNYQDDDTCPGTHTISHLSSKKAFGKKWFTLSEKEQDDIWHALFFIEDSEKLKQYAIKKWGFDENQAIAVSKWFPKDGYAQLSRKAINNILPFLKMGFTYDIAVTFGGVRNAFGQKWNDLSQEEQQSIMEAIPKMVRAGTRGGYIEGVRQFLRNEFSLIDKDLKRLYHHSADIHAGDLLPKLPTGKEADREISEIRNPIVIQALFELRKMVNALISEHGTFDEIKIEMARDLKVSKRKRQEIRKEQKRLENQNLAIIGRLKEHNQVVSQDSILKFKLWEECGHVSPYSAKEINITQLFSGEVQIDHIFPWSRSLDDSFLNKTLCFEDENRKKGERTPYEYILGDFGQETWEQAKQRFLKTFTDSKEYPNRYRKFKRLVAQKFDEDFISRQLNDTRYISKEARRYLQKISANVNVAPGGLTANLRRKWGLDSILSEAGTKERSDHRHHAIDALVMACFKTSHLQEISKWNRYNRSYHLHDFPAPWSGFRDEAAKSITNILVSHKKRDVVVTKRVSRSIKNGKTYSNIGMSARDQLHMESVYGKRRTPQGEEAYHIRKPLHEIKTKTHVEKIVDKRIQKIITDRITELGGYTKDDKIPNGAFFGINDKNERIPLIKLPNRKGDPVPIYRVRISEEINNAAPLKKNLNKYVNPRNNHHVIIYETKEGSLKECVVNFWTVVSRKIGRERIVKPPEDCHSIITVLQKDEMYILSPDTANLDLQNPDYATISSILYRVQKLSGGGYFREFCFRKHCDARPDADAKKDYIYIKNYGNGRTGWFTYNPIRVKISVTGRLIACK